MTEEISKCELHSRHQGHRRGGHGKEEVSLALLGRGVVWAKTEGKVEGLLEQWRLLPSAHLFFPTSTSHLIP